MVSYNKFNPVYYLSASVLTHLLLLALLYFARPFTGPMPTIFNVDLVAPEKSVVIPQPDRVSPPEVLRKIPLARPHRKSPDKELPPDSLYGGGTGGHEEGSAPSGEADHAGRDKAPSPDSMSDTTRSSSDEKALLKDGPSLVPKSYLFDEKTIEKFAHTEGPAKKGLTFDTSEFKHRGYMRMLKERIENIWKYPEEAARQGISGDLYMKFSIHRNGKLGEIELIRTSGYRELDEAAMKAVKSAEPFWPLPDDWEKDTLDIKGHFIYIFGNTLVM